MSRDAAILWLKPFIARPIALAGLGILSTTVLAALFAPWLSPYDPNAIDPVIRLTPPNAIHWFGTDQFGRDTLSRVIHSARMALSTSGCSRGVATAA